MLTKLNGDHRIPGAGVYKERSCSCVSLCNFNFYGEHLPDSVQEDPTTKKPITDMFSRNIRRLHLYDGHLRLAMHHRATNMLIARVLHLFNQCKCATLPGSTPPSKNIGLLPLTTDLCVQPSTETTPSYQNIPPYSTTICDAPRIYPSFPEYTPLFSKCICATLPEYTPLFNNYTIMRSHNIFQFCERVVDSLQYSHTM